MKVKTGIWIDTKKAIIIRLNGNDQEVKTIDSEIETRERTPGETKSFTRFGKQFFEFGNKKKKRLETERLAFVKQVADEVKDTEAIVLFGPAEMKNEMGKYMKEDRSFDKTERTIETTDSMSENQMVAWVKTYFENKK